MPRDLSKELSPSEANRLRQLLAMNPQIEEAPNAGGDYPKVLYTEHYGPAQLAFQAEIDPLLKKKLEETMQRNYRLVYDPDDELDARTDGMRSSPADFLTPDKDPRIPRGREGQKAKAQRRLTVFEDLQRTRALLAQLEEEAAGYETAAPEELPPARIRGLSRNSQPARAPQAPPPARARQVLPAAQAAARRSTPAHP